METKYYLVIDNNTSGPFNLSQLREMNLADDTLIWYDGLGDWKKLADLPILRSRLSEQPTPPSFNATEFAIQNGFAKQAFQPIDPYSQQFPRPNNYLAEAIISVLFCFPLAFIAIYKASRVNKLYDEGRHYEALDTATQARNWAIAAVALGVRNFLIAIL